MSYKIKFRSSKHDNLSTGWYIYSRHPFPSRLKNGRLGFRRYRMAGPYKSKADSVVEVGLLKLKSQEFIRRLINDVKNFRQNGQAQVEV